MSLAKKSSGHGLERNLKITSFGLKNAGLEPIPVKKMPDRLFRIQQTAGYSSREKLAEVLTAHCPRIK